MFHLYYPFFPIFEFECQVRDDFLLSSLFIEFALLFSDTHNYYFLVFVHIVIFSAKDLFHVPCDASKKNKISSFPRT